MQEFESSVVLDGTKTIASLISGIAGFESSVVLDGTKTPSSLSTCATWFESSVVLDGTKTLAVADSLMRRLRVVLF